MKRSKVHPRLCSKSCGDPENDLGPGSSLDENVTAIEIAHPIGHGDNQLIARFFSRVERNAVVQKAKITINKKVKEGKGLRIVEDMIKTDYELKVRAFKQMQQAFNNRKKVRFTKGKLVIDGEEVPIDK